MYIPSTFSLLCFASTLVRIFNVAVSGSEGTAEDNSSLSFGVAISLSRGPRIYSSLVPWGTVNVLFGNTRNSENNERQHCEERRLNL